MARKSRQTWLFGRQSLYMINLVNCGFCSNRILLYFPLCICLCTGVTFQLFLIIWWFRAWKPFSESISSRLITLTTPTTWPPGPPCIALSPSHRDHRNRLDHLDHPGHHEHFNRPDHLTTRPLDHVDQWPPWPCQLQIYSVYAYCISFKYCHQIVWCKTEVSE